MVFPFPFSILGSILVIGLIVARKMKNQTKFAVTLLALIDILLKLNWIWLVIYLYLGSYNISAFIISYCLFSNFVNNFILWRLAYNNNRVAYDRGFRSHKAKYPYITGFFLYMSYLVSFHAYRFLYSGLFGKKCFSLEV